MTIKSSMVRGLVLVAAAVAITGLGVGSASASNPDALPFGATFDFSARVTMDLMHTHLAPDAMGETRLDLTGDNEGIEIDARADVTGLPADHGFTFCVNGMAVDHADSDDEGDVDFRGELTPENLPHRALIATIRFGEGCSGAVALFGVFQHL